MNATTSLPPLSDERVQSIEREVFSRIAADRRAARTRRTRWWGAGGAAAAAVVVVAAILAPGFATSGGGVSGASDSSVELTDQYAADSPALVPESGNLIPEAAAGSDLSASDGTERADSGSEREMITTASAMVSVRDVAAAADAVAAEARERGGFVESVSVGTNGSSGVAYDGAPVPVGDGWITVRVPSDQLDATLAALADVGEVDSSSVSRQDVTDQAIDLRARIAASEASVARLTELMAQAADVADLIAAESALSERQATLESDRQQLAWLEGQVSMSSLSVQLVAPADPVEADPAGFGDGVATGWNGLIATLNGFVIALGFLLPWIGVAAVIVGLVFGVRALVRGARRRREARTSPRGDGPVS